MSKKRHMPAPRWIKSREAWRMDAMYKGQRKVFTSHERSPQKADADFRRQYNAWLRAVDIEVGDTSPVIADAWKSFIDYYGKRNKITSTKQIDSRGKAHILRHYRSRRVDRMRKQDWQAAVFAAYDARISKGKSMSPKTIDGIITTIKSFTEYCAMRGWIVDEAVPKYLENPAPPHIPEKRILQPKQLMLLLSSESLEWYLPAFRFLVLTGLRRGELCALQTNRDYIDGIITVRESISHDLDVTDGKNKNARRSFAPMPLALNALEEHRERCKEYRITSEYLFCDETGDKIRPRVLGNRWRKWREKYGIESTLHELRHTFISYARLMSGIDLDHVKELVGHSEAMNTDGVYVHAYDKTPEERKAEEIALKARAEALNSTFINFLALQSLQ